MQQEDKGKKEEKGIPDATGILISFGVTGGLDIGAELVLAVTFWDGPDKGNTILYSSGAIGVGLLDIYVGTEFIRYTYNGDIKNFDRYSITGKSTSYSGGALGIDVSYSRGHVDSYGGYVESFSLGTGKNKGIGWRMQEVSTKMFRQFRNK